MPDLPDRYRRFDGFSLDTQARELRTSDGVLVPLSAKAHDTLCCLIDNRHRVVPKDELLAAVWPGRVVEENNLTQAISTLRRGLGAGHRCIVTVPGRGYRFVADLEPGAGLAHDLVAPGAPAPGRRTATPPTLGLWALLALVAILAWVLRDPPAPTPTAKETLAVLPFRSLSNGDGDPLLASGLAETLIARISSSTALTVRPIASRKTLSGADQDPLDEARQIGATYLVMGTTQRMGSQMRVNVRLLAVDNGHAVWSGTFDERADRLFTLQDGIATAVTTALATRLTTSAVAARSPCEAAGSEANRAYLAGRQLLERPTGVRMQQAVASFLRAVALDPGCARAHARLAFAYRALSMTGDQEPARMFPLAEAAVAQALRIDPLLAEAHSTQGFIRFWYHWDWRGSEASFRRAIELNPGLAEAHVGFAHLLSNLGRHEEAVMHARQAVALDPLSPMTHTLAANFLALAGHADEARAVNGKARELDPDFWVAILGARASGNTASDHGHRIAELQRARELCGNCSQVMAVLGQTYVQAGDSAAAAVILEQMQQRDRDGYVPATSLATVRNALGDTDIALALLERAFEERDIRMTFLRVDKRWDNLREDPRFQSLERRMDFDGGAGASAVATVRDEREAVMD